MLLIFSSDLICTRCSQEATICTCKYVGHRWLNLGLQVCKLSRINEQVKQTPPGYNIKTLEYWRDIHFHRYPGNSWLELINMYPNDQTSKRPHPFTQWFWPFWVSLTSSWREYPGKFLDLVIMNWKLYCQWQFPVQPWVRHGDLLLHQIISKHSLHSLTPSSGKKNRKHLSFWASCRSSLQ